MSPQALSDERVLLLTEGNCMRDHVLGSCTDLAARQKITGLTSTLQGSSINTIRHMVASGLGISVLPATALTENDHMLFSIIPFESHVPTRRILLAYRRNFVRPKALSAIRKAIFRLNYRVCLLFSPIRIKKRCSCQRLSETFFSGSFCLRGKRACFFDKMWLYP